MTYHAPRKTPDPALRKALTIVGGATAGAMLLLCGLCGVVSLATTGDDDEPGGGVTATAQPAGVERLVSAPVETPASPSSTPSPSPSLSLSPTPSPVPATSSPAPKPPASKKPAVPPPPPKTTKPAAPPPPEDEPDVYYANCDAARRAGAAPIYRGEPGYRKGLDRDNDGVACETD
ncbi:excalibur calcium-binding domain-containing protein [Phytohabitans kaempferiae]|uniref:Excalibur calcium-binding domain-containing protein n=1 Tax=Phytohabitans kaempferiae TaxID=1620943 RepID=A0ABV6MCM2_9ACTN